MFDPIVERLSSYQKVISINTKKLLSLTLNFIKNINKYLLLNINKIKYNFELKQEYYYLGKYLSNLKINKYDLSHDKIFIDYIEKIKFKNTLIKKNNDELSSLSTNEKEDI